MGESHFAEPCRKLAFGLRLLLQRFKRLQSSYGPGVNRTQAFLLSTGLIVGVASQLKLGLFFLNRCRQFFELHLRLFNQRRKLGKALFIGRLPRAALGFDRFQPRFNVV